jgi:hypothetical protein
MFLLLPGIEPRLLYRSARSLITILNELSWRSIMTVRFTVAPVSVAVYFVLVLLIARKLHTVCRTPRPSILLHATKPD